MPSKSFHFQNNAQIRRRMIKLICKFTQIQADGQYATLKIYEQLIVRYYYYFACILPVVILFDRLIVVCDSLRIINRFSIIISMENKNKKTFLNLFDQANSVFQNYKYEESGLKPTLYFWKQMVSLQKQTPRVLIPDTLIINDKDNPIIWVYTNKEGRLEKNTNISLKDYVSKITNYCSPNELSATLKRLTLKEGNNNCGNDVKLVNSRYLHNLSIQQLGDQMVCLQKYIKSHGNHAFVCRTVYRPKKLSYCFLITNKKSYYDEEEPQAKRFLVLFGKKCHIIKSTQGKHLKQTKSYLQEIVRYFRFHRGITLSEIVGDFVKDEQNNWWLVNIKAFIIEAQIYTHLNLLRNKENQLIGSASSLKERKSENYQKQKYQKTKNCKYCEKTFLQSELTHRMTKKMLIEMDRYLLHLGKEYSWLARSDITNVDSHCLYQQHKICQRCYRLYTQIQSLMNVEGEFLVRLGFQLEKNPKELLMSLTNTQELEMQSKNKEIHNLKRSIPEVIELSPNSNILVKDNCPIRNDQIINRMYRYRVIFYFNEIDQVSQLKPNYHYFLQYTLFGSKHKIKIESSAIKSNSIELKKLRISYFFANSNQDVQEYLKMTDNFKINLICEHNTTFQKRVIGYLQIEMKDFLNANSIKKNFYKFFHVEGIAYGWGLQGSIGIIRSDNAVNTSRLIFSTEDKLVYLPNQSYYYCEYLPQEWIDQIRSKQVKTKKKTKRLDPQSENQLPSESKHNFSALQPQQTVGMSQKSQGWQSTLASQIKQYERYAKVKKLVY